MFKRLLTNEDDERSSSLDEEYEDSSVAEIVGGKLSFSEGDHASSSADKYRSWSSISGSEMSSGLSPRKSSLKIAFEIVSAKTITDAKKKYVSYTVLVKRAPGLETQPGVLERRYSDFLTLYQALRRRHPPLLSGFSFPRKALLGNFTADVIAERSVAFQHFLAYAHSVRELRRSPELADFLHGREEREARALMRLGRFEESAVLLENVYFVQEKVLPEEEEVAEGGRSSPLFRTLCVLVACLNAVDNVREAQRYGEAALALVPAPARADPLAVPFLVLSVRLWWAVGKDKKFLEQRLQELRRDGVNTDCQPTLLELVLREEDPPRAP